MLSSLAILPETPLTEILDNFEIVFADLLVTGLTVLHSSGNWLRCYQTSLRPSLSRDLV